MNTRCVRARKALAAATTAIVASVTLFAGVSSAGVAPPFPPHIVAEPNNLMVNTYTTLTGVGFPASTTISLEECGETNWVVPQDPCGTNGVTVTTNASGGFVTTFKVTLCPDGVRGPEPTSEICYIGVPKPSGIDTVELIGAAEILVTYP